MPTAAKLVAALLFAALAWWVGESIVRYRLPDGVRVGWLREMLALGGLVVGWRTVGGEATGRMRRGTTIPRAVTAGIAAAAQLLVLALLLHSFGRMIANSLDRKYAEIGRAWGAWMDFLWQDVVTVADPLVLGTLFAGAAAVGPVSGFVGRRAG